jgi:hypothetical protein
VDLAVAIVQVRASQLRVIVIEKPEADARHIEGVGSDRGDSGQRIAKIGRTGTRNLDQRCLELNCLQVGSHRRMIAHVLRTRHQNIVSLVEISAAAEMSAPSRSLRRAEP